MQSVVIVGAGGFGREVLEIFKDQNKISEMWDILGFIDENKELWGKLINGYPVLGGLDWLTKPSNKINSCVCAINTSDIRKEVIRKLDKIGVNYINAIHPSVVMSDSVKFGYDVVICAGSILTTNIEIGNHVHINLNCTVGHDAVISSYCTLSPGVSINGHNKLGEVVYVGTGAVFVQNVSVGDLTTIGAGAVVIENIPEKVCAVGVPAKVVKEKVIIDHS